MPDPTPNPPVNTEKDSSALASEIVGSLSPAPAAPPEPPKPPEAAPAATPSDTQKPSSTPPPATQKPPTAPAAPATVNVDDPKLSAPELRKHLKQVLADKDKTLAEKETTLSQVQSRLKELESKKFWTPDDQKKFDELASGKAQLEAQLYARDYRESPEYKKQFQDKLDEQFAEATEVVKSLNVSDGEGNTRPGSEQDLLKLYRIGNLAERKKAAKELFGEEFQEALDAVAPMIATKKAADQAINDKRTNFETERKAAEEGFQKTALQIQQFEESALASLAQADPSVFGVTKESNAQAFDALQKARGFISETVNKSGSFSVNERAARNAVMKSMMVASPVLRVIVSQQAAELAALKEKLAGYEKSDPGNAGDGGGSGGAGAGKEVGGSDSLATEIAGG